MKTSIVVAMMLATLTSATAICPNIGGPYYAVENYRLRIQVAGEPAENENGSGSASITLNQTGCRFSYRMPNSAGIVGGNLVRRGSISNLRITLDTTPVAILSDPNFRITKNEFNGSGTIEEYQIVINGYGELVGTYGGRSFTLQVWTEAVLTAGQIVPHVATPEMTPPGVESHLDQLVTIQCGTPNAAIRYTVDGSQPAKTSPLYAGPIKVNRSQTIKARAFRGDMLPSDVAANLFTIRSRWALLLHGMKGKPSDWDAFCDQYFPGPKIDIFGGVKKQTGKPAFNSDGIRCYRVDFGFYDRTKGRPGIGVTAAGDKSGDFCDFNVLGDEVAAAVRLIRKQNPDSQIVLIGHSRGGLAARAFLQRAEYQNLTGNVAVLLTTGTPHGGSPLGRMYQYLKDNPTDLSWVAQIATTLLNARRPTVSDLAPGSTELTSLNDAWQMLPGGVQYGCLKYSGHALGDVGVLNLLGVLSEAAAAYVLDGSDPGDLYEGDGIVPLRSQGLSGIITEGAVPLTELLSATATFHIDEPKQGADILSLWNSVLDEWIAE